MVAGLRPGPRLPPVVTNCLFASEMAPGIRGRGCLAAPPGIRGFDSDHPLTASVTVGWRVTAEAGHLHLAPGRLFPSRWLVLPSSSLSSSASLELAHAAWIMARLRPRHHSDEYFLARGQRK